MNKQLALSLTLLALAMGANAQEETKSDAATSESKVKLEDAAGTKNKVQGDIDEEITNAKLRAESGSKSKLSVSLTANYYGGSIEKPFSKDRPNPTNDPVAPKVRMGGDVGLRYRMDKNQSVSAGTGYSVERPFHEAKQGDVSTPFVTYNYATKIGKVQSITSGGVYLSTDSDEIEVGQVGQLNAAETMMMDIGATKASVGLVLDGTYTHYTKRYQIVQPKDQDALPAERYQNDYELAAYPIIEYAFTDKVNFRTVFRPWIFRHARRKHSWEFNKVPWTQSIGVGFAVTRDIYLYPNFQYDWEKWRSDDFNWARSNVRATSTIGLSATMNFM